MIADALYKSMKGLGTDDDLLIHTLSTRNPSQIEEAKAIFERKYPGESLEGWIKGDTSGDYMKVLLALSKSLLCSFLPPSCPDSWLGASPVRVHFIVIK